MRWTRSIEGLELLPYYIWLDLEQEGHAALAPVKVPILLPHEMMAMLHSAGPLQWAISMAGPRGKDGIAALWNHLAGLEEWRDHWALQAPRDTQGLIPIACHVDGTEVFTNQEHVVWSWSSVMKSCEVASIWDHKFLICAIPYKFMTQASTRNRVHAEIAKLIQWSLAQARCGVWPQTGYYDEQFVEQSQRCNLRGQSLANGWRMCFLVLKADLKARKEAMNFRRWYRCKFICDSCLAEMPSGPDHATSYKNLSTQGGWSRSVFTTYGFLQLERGGCPWTVVDGWSLRCCIFDVMHCAHLGILRDAVACCLAYLADNRLLPAWSPAANLDSKLRTFWCLMRDWFLIHREQPPRPVLSASNCGLDPDDDDYPVMGSVHKAMNLHKLLRYCNHVMVGLASALCREGRALAVAISSLWGFLRVLEHADLVLSCEEAREAERLLGMHLDVWQWLASEAAANQRLRYFIRPKHHCMVHVRCQLRDRMNPLAVACFNEEAFLGYIKRIGRSCHGRTASQRIAERYSLVLRWRCVERRKHGCWGV